MPCPICKKASEQAWRPFCSKRCADIDLAQWFGEGYVIGGAASPDDESAEIPAIHPVESKRDQ